MAVTSEIFDAEQQAQKPSRPFLWQQGGVVWLRSSVSDICVKSGSNFYGHFSLGECSAASTPDTMAWAQRLPSDKAVLLQNAK